MSIYKITSGDFSMCENTNTSYFLISEQDENNLQNSIKENFYINISDIKELTIIENYPHHSLTVKLKNNKLKFKYNENKLPDTLKFYKYDMFKLNKPENDDDIKLKIHIGTFY